MKRKRILLIAILVAAVGAYLVWNNFLRTAPSMSRLDVDYRVEAVAFYAEFEEDEEAANARYLNKIVELEGQLEAVEITEGKPVLSLKTDGFGLIKCTLEGEKAPDLSPNTSVVIKGECIGMLLDVLIERAIVIQPK